MTDYNSLSSIREYSKYRLLIKEVLMNYKKYNRDAWDKRVALGDKWTRTISSDDVDKARSGELKIVLTPTKLIPRSWFPDNLNGVKILALASGGGQQGPVLAAAGADVTVFDNSKKQLEQDEYVAERDGLTINTVQGDMMDLSIFVDESFDIIVNPWSNCFVSDVNPVWHECHRILKPEGILMAGFGNPVDYIFDLKSMNEGKLIVRHSIPYADNKDLNEDELKSLVIDADEPLSFGHSLNDQIGGQLRAGFVLTDLYEDNSGENYPLDKYIDIGIATRAIKWK